MITDIIIIVVFLLGSFNGYKRGLLIGVIDLIGVFISIIVSYRFSYEFAKIIAEQFKIPIAYNTLGSFLILILIIHFVWKLLAPYLVKFVPKQARESSLAKVLGSIVSLVYTFLIVGVIIWTLEKKPFVFVQKYTSKSKLINIITRNLNPVLDPYGSVIDQVIEEVNSVYLSPTIGEVKKLNIGYSELTVDISAEKEMIISVNKERESVGLGQLLLSKDLTEVARSHGLDMWQRQYFAHINPNGLSPFDRLDKYGIKYLFAGENLALAPNVSLAHQGLMLSPTHRENILETKFHKIGVGAISGGKRSGIIFVQLFSN